MGMLLLSLGSLLFALPHFLSEPYVYQQGALDTENTCAAAHATGNGSTAGPASCSMSGGQEDLSHYLYIFIAGNTLHGIGGVPLYTLGLTYIDDIASRGTASVYIGEITLCLYCCAIFEEVRHIKIGEIICVFLGLLLSFIAICN